MSTPKRSSIFSTSISSESLLSLEISRVKNHSVTSVTSIARKDHLPGPWTVPNSDAAIVDAIADTMQKSAVSSQDQHDRCVWVANFLGVPIPEPKVRVSPPSLWNKKAKVAPAGDSQIDPYNSSWSSGRTNVWGGVSNPIFRGLDSSAVSRLAAATSNVFSLIERVSEFSGLARKAGFDPPDNPFTAISMLNAARHPAFVKLNVSATLASDLLFNIKAYLNLLEAYRAGAINLRNGTIDVSQLSHVKLSFDGLGGSGNVAVDIKSLLPSIDAQRKESARKALEVLDFRKRVPYLLFTADYRPDEDSPSKGTLVAWKRIPDASGYIIKRRSVFSGQELVVEVPSDEVVSSTKALLPYSKMFALSFMSSIDDKSVLIYKDDQPPRDEYFIYKVQAYQIRNDNQTAIFSAESVPVSLTPAAQASITEMLKKMSNWPDYTVTGWTAAGEEIRDYNNFVDSISPWPAFSQYVYGDASYDWVLAAANIRAVMNRKDKKTARKLSYLNANSQDLFSLARDGRFVKPIDISKVAASIETSIQKFGVTQVIQALLDETGVTYYFEGRDPPEDNFFHKAGNDPGLGAGGNFFESLASAIDPDTATLDLNHLASNMSALLNQQTLGVNTRLTGKDRHPVDNKPTEVAVPDPNDATNVAAEGQLQFVNKLGDMRDGVIDLTTFDGISKLMRAIRIMSDFGPGRVPPKQPPADKPKPPPPPPPEPPPEPPSDNYFFDYAPAG